LRFNIKFIPIIFIPIFIWEDKLLSTCINNECQFLRQFDLSDNLDSDNIFAYQEVNTDYILKNDLENILKKENFRVEKILSNIIEDPTPESNIERFSIDIVSDKQYSEGNNIFVAEGNAILKMNNGNLHADKLTFKRNERIFVAEGNVFFKKGKQYLEADYFEYDLNNDVGFLKNVYAVTDFKNLETDLNINGFQDKKNLCQAEEINLIDLPEEINLLGSNNVRFNNKLSLNSFDLDFQKISQWRFKSPRINIKSNKWTAKEIYFSNDPYNPAQFIVESRDFEGEISNKFSKLTSHSTYAIFENKIKIPLGKRVINDDKNVRSKWGFGYNKKNMDGLFISRNSNKIKLGENFNFNFKSFYFLERNVRGYSEIFRPIGSSFVEEKEKSTINFRDVFGLDTNLEGSIGQWNLIMNNYLGSLDLDRFHQSYKSNIKLKKRILTIENDFISKKNNDCIKDIDLNKNIEESQKKFTIDQVLYGSYGQDDIYSSYGTKIINRHITRKLNRESKNALIFDIGRFQGKENSGSNLINSERYGVLGSFEKKYKLLDFSSNKIAYDNSFKYAPKLNDKGLFYSVRLSSGIYKYNNNETQDTLSITFGPLIKLGNSKKNILDYSSLSLLSEYVIFKNGKSPFEFDDFNESNRLELIFKQQLYGPLLFGFSSNISLDNNDYGQFSNKRYILEFSRRAYSINGYYEMKDKEIGIGFKIYNFKYKGYDSSF